MLRATPQERLALGVTALLLALGAAVRVLGTEPAPPELRTGGPPSDTLPRAEHPEPRLRPGERLDPNRATAAELDRLPRVGPALAARIVAHRQERGPFRTLDDLDAVPGVGPALLAALAPHLALPPGGARGGRAGRPADAGVDLNRATEAELEALPGIGPALARRIVEWRRQNGPFRSLDDLQRVPGIGPALKARLAPLVRAGG